VPCALWPRAATARVATARGNRTRVPEWLTVRVRAYTFVLRYHSRKEQRQVRPEQSPAVAERNAA
jgi:hypothetical protein